MSGRCADRLGAYGYALPTSPTIDRRLAAAGMTFDEVYAQSPKTTPSHMTMLTSLPPCVHGVLLWDTNTPGRVLNPAVHTLAEVLKKDEDDDARFQATVDRIEALGPSVLVGCHTPVVDGRYVDQAIAATRRSPSAVVPPEPDQAVLDQIQLALLTT